MAGCLALVWFAGKNWLSLSLSLWLLLLLSSLSLSLSLSSSLANSAARKATWTSLTPHSFHLWMRAGVWAGRRTPLSRTQGPHRPQAQGA